MTNYNGVFTFLVLILLHPTTSSASRIEENPCVTNVAQSVQTMAKQARADISLWTNNQVPGRYYTQDARAFLGFENHFQGAQRLRNSSYVVVSGAVLWQQQPQLFVLDVGSRSSQGDFDTNLSKGKPLPANDRIVKRIDFPDHVRWHVGGLSQLGDIIAVPLEDTFVTHTSRILFIDFSSPLHPVILPVEIDRHPGAGTGVALERLADGRFILAAQDKDGNDFYYSKTARLEDGFTIPPIHAHVTDGLDDGGQSIQLIRQCDGKLYFANLTNDGAVPPILNGKDWLGLHEVQGVNGNASDSILITPVARARFQCADYCNFSAAAGLYISDDRRLHLYSTPFYRTFDGKLLHLAEFAE